MNRTPHLKCKRHLHRVTTRKQVWLPCLRGSGIHVGDNVYEALSFVCYYVRNVQDEYLVIPERKDGMVILETPKWNPIRQANFVASLNKMAVDQAKKRYPEMEVPNERPFTCLSFARKSFVYFPDLKVYQEVFLKMYLGLVRLQEVHLLG